MFVKIPSNLFKRNGTIANFCKNYKKSISKLIEFYREKNKTNIIRARNRCDIEPELKNQEVNRIYENLFPRKIHSLHIYFYLQCTFIHNL